MEHRHLDLDGLLSVSYGLAGGVGDCPDCRAAVERMARQRQQPCVEDNLPEWFWRRQSRAIQDEIQVPSRPRWISIAALAGVLGAALLAIQPQPKSPPKILLEDQLLLQDVSATVNRVEPRALAPMDLLWAQ
jgi:hypothetical protein